MARDPFAPVTQPTVPQWVWIIAGVFGVLVITMGVTAAVVISRRAPAPVQPLAQPQAPPVASPTATAAVGTPAAPDKAPDKGDKAAPAENGAPKADAKDERGDRRHRRHKEGGGGASAGPAKPAGAAPATPAPKKKSDMSQKEIDSLLGL